MCICFFAVFRKIDNSPIQPVPLQESAPLANTLGKNVTTYCKKAVEWERANPPNEFKPEKFDYAAEDEVLARFRATDRESG